MTSYEQAEQEMREALGLGTADPPKWTRAMLSKEQQGKIRSLRYRFQAGHITKDARDCSIQEIVEASQQAYHVAHPRHPRRWRRIVNHYLKLRPKLVQFRRKLNREQAQLIVAYDSPERAAKRKAEKDSRRRVRFAARERKHRWVRARLTVQSERFEGEYTEFVTKPRKTLGNDP